MNIQGDYFTKISRHPKSGYQVSGDQNMYPDIKSLVIEYLDVKSWYYADKKSPDIQAVRTWSVKILKNETSCFEMQELILKHPSTRSGTITKLIQCVILIHFINYSRWWLSVYIFYYSLLNNHLSCLFLSNLFKNLVPKSTLKQK